MGEANDDFCPPGYVRYKGIVVKDVVVIEDGKWTKEGIEWMKEGLRPMIKDFDELCEIIWKSHPDWQVLQEDVDAGKHDCTNYSYLLRYKDGSLYTFDIERSYNEGLDPGNAIAYPFTPDKAEITGEYKQYTYQIKKDS